MPKTATGDLPTVAGSPHDKRPLQSSQPRSLGDTAVLGPSNFFASPVVLVNGVGGTGRHAYEGGQDQSAIDCDFPSEFTKRQEIGDRYRRRVSKKVPLDEAKIPPFPCCLRVPGLLACLTGKCSFDCPHG